MDPGKRARPHCSPQWRSSRLREILVRGGDMIQDGRVGTTRPGLDLPGGPDPTARPGDQPGVAKVGARRSGRCGRTDSAGLWPVQGGQAVDVPGIDSGPSDQVRLPREPWTVPLGPPPVRAVLDGRQLSDECGGAIDIGRQRFPTTPTPGSTLDRLHSGADRSVRPRAGDDRLPGGRTRGHFHAPSIPPPRLSSPI